MKYKYLLFDLDGTLIDTTEGVYKSAQYALTHFGINVGFDELKPIFGPPLKQSFMNLFNLNDTEATDAVKFYLERYQQFGINESKVFPEIPSLLNDLKNTDILSVSPPQNMRDTQFRRSNIIISHITSII